MGIAVALLVIPITIMVFSSLTGRVDYDEYRRGIAAEGEDLNATDRFLSTTKLEKFKDVKLSSPNHTLIHLHLIHSEEYGIKKDNQNSEGLSHDIDQNGTLHISPEDRGYFHTIYLYAPSFERVVIDNIQIGELSSDQDSLSLVLNNSRNDNGILVTENPNLTYLHLTLNNAVWKIKGSNPMFEKLKTVRLDLDSSSITMASEHYNQIIVTGNDSQFKLTPPDNVVPTIGSLNLNMSGNSLLSLKDNTQIDSLSGTLSDSTTVNLPYYMIRNLAVR